ncbi:hypothetical protein BT67DRAFT_390203 [Trichocladium antarcticum]|uniref:Ubiquitin-like protein smt3 n=1 Tax=Trichocladium antarcticum TaxID=1450529 RepID=A0AAN6UD07_9PEZI|nr:hypothetical protein BT67DRAFT_390203 [Trichocladium antarcticum]
MAPKTADDIASGITKLSLRTTALDEPTPTPQRKSSPVADSWEDEADDDNGSGPDSDADRTPVASTSHAGTSAPPPTPMSPVASSRRPFSPSALNGPDAFGHPAFDGPSDSSPQPHPGGATGPSRRPEKTDAVARRMIASALGMKAPKATEEQRAYDRAVREKERKRREEEKERERKREEEASRARQAIWDD